MANTMKMYYQNVRGLRTKTSIFFNNLLNCDSDFICLSETWLLPGILDSELFDSRYNVYRCDRNYDLRGDTLGGGVLIAVRRGIEVKDITCVPSTNSIADIIYLTVIINKGKQPVNFRLVCCYFPPCNSLYSAVLEFFEYISNIMIKEPYFKYILIGDFNIGQAQWSNFVDSNAAHLSCNVDIPLVEALSAFLSFNGLQQYNMIPNHCGKQLDLLISNIDCVVSRAVTPLVAEDRYHPALTINFNNISMNYLRSPKRTVILFHLADYSVICSKLDDLDWDSILDQDNIDKSVASFYGTVNNIIAEHIPSKVVYDDSRYPFWYSKSLIKIIKEKLKYHKKWKIYNNLDDYDNFSKARDRQKLVQAQCYASYLNLAESKIQENSKYFWRFVKSKRSHSNLPDTMFLGSAASSEGSIICDLFNKHFHSVFEPAKTSIGLGPSNHPCSSDNCINLNSLQISVAQVSKYLKSLDVSKSAGPDGIPPIFLRQCCEALSKPISILFNFSLQSCCVPLVWKTSYVVPIFKSGDKHDIGNYRPISKLSTIPKLFEKIIYDDIYPVIRPYIVQEQHGFVDGKSTESNLCEFVDVLFRSMDEGFQVDAVYTDYSKAFDKISHDILLQKLLSIGVHGDLLRWLESYLRDRSQAVAIKGFCSSFIPVTSGVPQGSHLGPLLFNIFINDVINCFKFANCLLYADDKKIYKVIRSPDDCLKLQSDLIRLSGYCRRNFLFLNVAKCSCISFSRKKSTITFNYSLNDELLKRVTVVKDLGVLLDNKLILSSHIEDITVRAYRLLGFILRVGKEFNNAKTLIILYNSLVRPILEYASNVWNSQYQIYINSLERIQNKFLKHLNFRNSNSFSYNPITFKIDTLQSRRTIKDQMLLFKILRNVIDSPYLLSQIDLRCPRFNARFTNKLFNLQPYNTNYACNSFVPRACKSHNDQFSGCDIFSLSKSQFKHQISLL